jgi:hypothetical protein
VNYVKLLVSGTAIGSPKQPREPHFLSQTKIQTNSQPSGRGPRTWRPQRPTRTIASAPLGRNSVSLEGYNTTLIKLRLARGSHGLAAPTPAPSTGAFNVLTHADAQVKDESTPCRPSDTPGNHIHALFRQPSR